mgnify:CR=1 FL=1
MLSVLVSSARFHIFLSVLFRLIVLSFEYSRCLVRTNSPANAPMLFNDHGSDTLQNVAKSSIACHAISKS